jgi:hypothetical protein
MLALFTVAPWTVSGASGAQTVGGASGAKGDGGKYDEHGPCDNHGQCDDHGPCDNHGQCDDHWPCDNHGRRSQLRGVVASGLAVANNPGYALDATT